MTDFLLFLWECGDESLIERITLLEERIFFCHLAFNALWLALSIALGCQAVGSDSMLDQIADHILCTLL
jgi:hypothetical protein